MLEKYEAPEVEFVEMEDEDIMTASACSGYVCDNYGNTCTGYRGGK